MENNYGEEFRAMREELRLTQKTVATQMGISSTVLSLKENGQREFKVLDFYQAYIHFGIDVGFGPIFDYIDNHENLEPIASGFPNKIKEIIQAKDYKTISIKILEQLKERLLFEGVETYFITEDINTQNITEEEKMRLSRILMKYQAKDGNIKRAIKLLEIAMQ